MMEDIDGHRHIIFVIRKRQACSVKFADRDRSAGSNQYIDALDAEIGAHIEKGVGKQAVAAADVEHSRRFG
jgi:hypothetical protein